MINRPNFIELYPHIMQDSMHILYFKGSMLYPNGRWRRRRRAKRRGKLRRRRWWSCSAGGSPWSDVDVEDKRGQKKGEENEEDKDEEKIGE